MPRTTIENLSADLERFSYLSSGDPDAAPVLLVHGLGGSALTWQPLAAQLANTRRVIAPDLRGHGASSWTAGYAVDDMAGDLLALLDHLEIARTAVVAHSMGAMVGYRVASRRPGRVARLVLEDPPPPLPADPPRQAGPRPAGALDYDWRIQDQFSRERNAPPTAWLADLEAIVAPTVIARGRDSHIRPDQVASMSARIADCRTVEFDAGHDVHVERPDEFAQLVREFLDQQ